MTVTGSGPGARWRWGAARRPFAVLLSVGVAVGALSCGVPLDDAPRGIALSTSTTTTTPTTTTVRTLDDEPNARIYFIDQHSGLRAEDVTVDDPTIAGALTALLSTEPPTGLKSRIPSGTRLLGTRTQGERITIDLSEEMHDIESPLDRIAYAQLTFTALQFGDHTRVAFQIEGTPVDAPTDDGNRKVVRADDYVYPLVPR